MRLCSRVVRKSIARVLTVINQTTKAQLRAHYAGRKWVPLDLRPKLTRAKRHALTKHQQEAKTLRQVKKIRNLPTVNYAVLA